MEGNNRKRRGPWKWLAAAVVGLSLFSVVAQPAEAARFRRGWGWGGYRAYRMPYRAYPRYGYGYGYGYGYRRVVPRIYFGGGYPYGSGYGYGGYSAPMRPGLGYYNYAPPML
jgi:hypothetical protein